MIRKTSLIKISSFLGKFGGLLRQTLKQDYDPVVKENTKEIQQVKAFLAMVVISVVYSAQYLTGTFYPMSDFDKMEEDEGMKGYRWEYSQTLLPVLKTLMAVLVCSHIIMTLAFLRWHQISCLYFPFLMLQLLVFNLYPLDFGAWK